MKIAVIGAGGQLGTDLCRQIASPDLIALFHKDIEITDMASARKALRENKPDVIVNTAAFVRVDDCEVYPDRCFQINALGARNVTVVAEEIGAKVIYISSDYVFGGEGGKRETPYTEFDTAVPLNTLGRAKVAGEDFVKHLCPRHFIIRVSGLYGTAGSSGKGGNFIETILKLARERNELRVVNDQVTTPTYTKDLARKILELTATDYYGTFHITNKGSCSWHTFAQNIVTLANIKIPVIPITSDMYPQKAKRPGYSAMDNYHLRLLGMDDMRPWEMALREYMKEKGHLTE